MACARRCAVSRRSKKCCASPARPEMPVFRYKAVNPAGDVAIGELEAANEGEIVDRLRDQGMMPMQVAAAAASATGAAAGTRAPGAGGGQRRGWFTPKKVTRDHLMAATRELA